MIEIRCNMIFFGDAMPLAMTLELRDANGIVNVITTFIMSRKSK